MKAIVLKNGGKIKIKKITDLNTVTFIIQQKVATAKRFANYQVDGATVSFNTRKEAKELMQGLIAQANK